MDACRQVQLYNPTLSNGCLEGEATGRARKASLDTSLERWPTTHRIRISLVALSYAFRVGLDSCQG
eukprot:1159456-Pelagomonas_calceolata.AAC.2